MKHVYIYIPKLYIYKLYVQSSFALSEYKVYVININLVDPTKAVTKRHGLNLNLAFIACTEDTVLDFRHYPYV